MFRSIEAEEDLPAFVVKTGQKQLAVTEQNKSKDGRAALHVRAVTYEGGVLDLRLLFI